MKVIFSRKENGEPSGGWLRCDGKSGACGNTSVGGVDSPTRGGQSLWEVDGKHYCIHHLPKEPCLHIIARADGERKRCSDCGKSLREGEHPPAKAGELARTLT